MPEQIRELSSLTSRGFEPRNQGTSRLYWVGLTAVSAVSLWIRAGFRLTAMPVYVHDDQLFVKLGHDLAAGQWLGPYDNLTLAKGMFYPMFIATAFWASIPLKIAEHIFYLLACGLTASVSRRYASDAFSVLLFAALAFNPVFWNYGLERTLRQCVYPSVALAVVTLVVMVAFPPPGVARGWLRNAVLGVLLGLAGAAYWLTREEGIWLVPSIAVVVVVALVGIFRPDWSLAPHPTDLPDRITQLKRIGLPLMIALLVFTAADLGAAALNYQYYGIFETNEFRAKNFLRAYGALSRIQHDHYRYLVTIPETTWERAYSVSPAAQELSKYLEATERPRWLQITCSYGTLKPCDDVQTGYDMWELRDAVADAGHYKSGADAMRFYGELADEIDAACNAKKIPCLPPRSTMQPPFRPEYVKLAWQDAKQVTHLVFAMREGPVDATPSVGSADALAIFTDTTDGIYLPEKKTTSIQGWVAAATGEPTIHIENRSGDPSETSIAPVPAPDVVRVYPALKSYRFQLRTNCPASQCDVVLDAPGLAPTRFPLDSIMRRGPIPPSGQTANLMGYIEVVSGSNAFALSDLRRNLQTGTADKIAEHYSYFFSRIWVLSALGLLMATLSRRRFPLPLPLLALGLSSAAAVAVYIALMSYVKATADMNVITVQYLSPASPFVIAFTLLGLYAWYSPVKSFREKMLQERLEPVRTIQHI